MERSYQLDSALEGLTGSAIRTFIDGLLSGIDRALSAVIRMSVQFVLTTSSKTVGARSMRPAPDADQSSSGSSETSS
jgi:hypothetical protein